MRYQAKVKYNGNHYYAGELVKGSKVKQFEDETYCLLDDAPFYGEGRNEWVEIDIDTLIESED